MKPLNRFGQYTILLPVLMLIGCAGSQLPLDRGEFAFEPVQARINPLVSQDNPVGDAAYHLLVAEIAIFRDQTDIAIEHYLKLARTQDNPEIAERAVRIAVYGQNLEAASEAAQRWIELEPDQIEAHQIIATIYIRQHNIDEAFQYLDDLIEFSDIEDRELFLSLLGVLIREKNSTTVLAVTHKIAKKYPDRAYAQYLHGMLAAQGGQPAIALEYLDRASAREEINGAHGARAKILLKLGRPDEAVISLLKAVLNRPNDQKLRLTYARLLVDVKQYERARVEFEKLYQASPDDVGLLYTLGLLSLESQYFDAAEKYMLKLVEMEQRPGEAQYYLGRINESRKRHDDAINWYRQVHIGEYRFDAQLRIAYLLGESGHFEEAHEHLKSMLKGSQSHSSLVRIYLAEGELLRSAKRYEEAMEVYDTALGIIPGNTGLLYARALTAERVGRIDILEQDIKTILKTEPDNGHALNALGFTLADQTDRYEEAYDYLKRAIAILPEDAAVIDSFGWVNYRLGKYEEAIRLLRKALERYDDSEIAAHLGEVLWVSGAQEEAKKVWKKALQKFPGDPFVQKAMRRLIP
ncbi:MAG: tetratricopeptide repeat protein [Proteobacteria bacterium]|nr:tetratricopeptide repeat protein [Pseudomonadota bacterium]